MPNNTQILKQLLKDLSGKNASQTAKLLEDKLLNIVDQDKKSTVLIESVIELTPTQKAQLEKNFPTASKFIYNLNPNLLGGIKIKKGDQLFDLSLLNTINTQIN